MMAKGEKAPTGDMTRRAFIANAAAGALGGVLSGRVMKILNVQVLFDALGKANIAPRVPFQALYRVQVTHDDENGVTYTKDFGRPVVAAIG